MVQWARRYNFKVSVRQPGRVRSPPPRRLGRTPWPSSQIKWPGSAAARLLSPWEEIKRIIDESDAALELITGNQKMADRIFNYLKERNELHRITFGSDTPTGRSHAQRYSAYGDARCLL
ncbi:MAG: hypothetical protein U0401_27880 [Anaerolineae bacterium]